jgi:hypothetical protein
MADHYLSLPGGLTACFRTACTIGRDVKLQLGAYVPGLTFTSKRPVDLTLDHKISDTPSLECKGTHITLCMPASDKFPDDLYHLLYGIERRELMKRGLYTVHAACVGKNGNYMLIAGHSGAGKTTLTQKLIDGHDMKLFSGNKTVIRIDADGGMTAIAGTKTMTALDSKQKRYAYELSARDYAEASEVKIKSIALVRINEGVEETQTLSPLSALHTLYPYFMDAVNADIIVNGRDVFDGTPDTQAKSRLTQALRDIFKTLPVRKHSGSMDFLQQRTLHP